MTTTREGTGALEKAMDILEAIGAAPDGMSQSQLSEAVGLPRTTLYRILSTLVDRGMIRRDPQRKVYRLGFRYLELVRNAYLSPDLVAAASFELRALRDLTGETSYLAVLEGNEVLSLERCDGAHSHRSAAALGQSKPVYCTSQGKAILSVMEEKARDAILKKVPLTPLTPLTITDRRRLNAELRITAARGYAIDDEEILLGVRCVGAPIIDSQGKVRGAMSVAGPAYRLTRERVELLGPELAEAARRVGAQLNSHDPRGADSPARQVEGPWSFHGAFPCWSSARQTLFWADTLAPAIRCFDGKQNRLLASLEEPVTALVPWGERLLVGLGHGWVLLDLNGQPCHSTRLPVVSLMACCQHPDGSLWGCHQRDNGQLQLGKIELDGRFTGLWSFNEPLQALAWDKQGEALYAVAPGSGTIYLMQTGSNLVRRLATLPKGSGKMSGLALDEQGGVWTTLQDGWSLVRFADDGNLDRLIGLPVPAPTDLCFGDDGSLFVTSARNALSMETLANAPKSGHLFMLQINLEEEHGRD